MIPICQLFISSLTLRTGGWWFRVECSAGSPTNERLYNLNLTSPCSFHHYDSSFSLSTHLQFLSLKSKLNCPPNNCTISIIKVKYLRPQLVFCRFFLSKTLILNIFDALGERQCFLRSPTLTICKIHFASRKSWIVSHNFRRLVLVSQWLQML